MWVNMKQGKLVFRADFFSCAVGSIAKKKKKNHVRAKFGAAKLKKKVKVIYENLILCNRDK